MAKIKKFFLVFLGVTQAICCCSTPMLFGYIYCNNFCFFTNESIVASALLFTFAFLAGSLATFFGAFSG